MTVIASGEQFRVSAASRSGVTFWIERAADGTVIHDCSAHGQGGCRAAADGAAKLVVAQ